MSAFRFVRKAKRVREIISIVENASCQCPAHAGGFYKNIVRQAADGDTHVKQSKEYAFQWTSSNIRYGEGVTSEVGLDVKNLGSSRVCLMTDKNLVSSPSFQSVLDSLTKAGVAYDLFDDVRIEPTDISLEKAISFARSRNFDCFVAVGGGSVIDTCKIANLYSSDPGAELLDYVNAPIGRGKPVTVPIQPLIAIPTTSGTGTEATGAAIFYYTPMKAKTGIVDRALRPTLGIIDPVHSLSMPERVAAYSGFDVLCHTLESYTAIPYQERGARPDDPLRRPAFQGSNPVSDVWAINALRRLAKYMKRSVFDAGDKEARYSMHMAASLAGLGLSSAGVHLCHGMSYPISGNNVKYVSSDYSHDHPLVPHGLSVVLTAPAVFTFTAPMCPERHLEAAEILGADVSNAKRDDAGPILADTLRQLMFDIKVDNGLQALGFSFEDIPDLVKGTIPQERVTKLAPRTQTEDDIAKLFEESLTVY